ncbi:MAG: LLM class flavin-dependent oxidoreductase [Acidobacteriota bacterium]|nr:LLM class flavin-dependent oxidoreductase [Acidobacteriota bacterium]
MKLGVFLPTFEATADPALAAADAAAAAGLDGVFAFDHLWPMRTPTRPALAPFPVLAAVATRLPQLAIGPLVARVGLVGTDHLVEEFATLAALAPGRVVAGLGTGDQLSDAENDAYGLAHRSARERRAMLRDAAVALRDSADVWVGAGGEATNAVARDLGVALNLWGVSPDAVAAAAAIGEVTWAGPVHADPAAILSALAAAGASWAVVTRDVELAALVNWRRENPLTTFH